jgi:type I restriction enzyme S subunit
MGLLDFSKPVRVPTTPALVERYLLRPGDVAFNNTNSAELVGKSAFISSLPEPLVFSNHFTRLRTRQDVLDPQFLALWLLAQWQDGTFERLCDRWIGQAAVGRRRLLNLTMPLPSLPEQKHIAAALREQMDSAARLRAAADAAFDRARELEMAEARAVFMSREASAWPVAALGETLATCSGLTPSRARSDYFGGHIPWVKTGELLDGTMTDTVEHVTEKALAETSLRLLPVDTLLVAMYGQGQTRGRTGLLGVPATTNQACFAVLPSEDVMNQQFLQYWFRVNYGRIRKESEGRGGNQPNLNGVLLRQQRIPHPAVVRRLSHVSETSQVVVDATFATRNSAEQLSSSLLRRTFSEGG